MYISHRFFVFFFLHPCSEEIDIRPHAVLFGVWVRVGQGMNERKDMFFFILFMSTDSCVYARLSVNFQFQDFYYCGYYCIHYDGP